MFAKTRYQILFKWRIFFFHNADPLPNIDFEMQNIGIKHGFSCFNVCQVPREMLKTEAEGRGFQQLPRNLANVNALENNV